LRSLLSRHFTDGVTLVTLVAVTSARISSTTGVYDSTFSHAFSFALIAALLWLTESVVGDAHVACLDRARRGRRLDCARAAFECAFPSRGAAV